MYAKLFSSILDSSLWTASHPTRILFLTMLAMADREGRIFASRSGLARRAVLTDEELEVALSQLSQPDRESSDLMRNPENEGRRVQPADGGWQIINYAYYRDLQDQEERRHADKMRQRKHREKSRSVTRGNKESRAVAPRHASESEVDVDPLPPNPLESHGGHEEKHEEPAPKEEPEDKPIAGTMTSSEYLDWLKRTEGETLEQRRERLKAQGQTLAAKGGD